MAELQTLRKQVKKQIDDVEDESLRIVKAVLEIEQEEDFWDHLTNQVKADVDEAKKESARGEGATTEEVMKKYEKWLSK